MKTSTKKPPGLSPPGQGGGSPALGIATIVDDGTGTIHTGDVTGGTPDTATSNLDDDRVLTVNGATYSVTPAGGAWTLDLANVVPSSGALTPLAHGQSYEVTATITDASGNTSPDVTTNQRYSSSRSSSLSG